MTVTAKKAGIIACIVSTVVSIATTIGLCFYFLYPQQNLLLENRQQIQFKATFNHTETIYMSINSTYIQYDLLRENQNQTGYLLTRFFSTPLPTFAQTFLTNSYIKKTNWDIFEIDNNNNHNFEIQYNSHYYPTLISLYGQMIYIDYLPDNITPYLYNSKYTITEFAFHRESKSKEKTLLTNDTAQIFDLLYNIKNPNDTEIMQDDDYISNLLPPKDVDPRCLIDMAYDAMLSGQNLVKTGYCNNYFVVGIGGTNFKNAGDIYANIKGALIDNFESGFNNLKNFDKTKVYDICTGYSLGGAIAKYMSKFKYCKNIVTFGSPLTHDYNKNIPIQEYINVMDDDSNGCCDYHWNMKCKTYGMLLTDPVTTILNGYHYNKLYIGKHNNNNCIGKFAYTVWKTGFHLHSSYQDNLP
jgi:hypothetical protein